MREKLIPECIDYASVMNCGHDFTVTQYHGVYGRV